MKTERILITYHEREEEWAAWLGWQLQEHRYDVHQEPCFFRTHDEFLDYFRLANTQYDRIIFIFSDLYFSFGLDDVIWGEALAFDPQGQNGLLIPGSCELR